MRRTQDLFVVVPEDVLAMPFVIQGEDNAERRAVAGEEVWAVRQLERVRPDPTSPSVSIGETENEKCVQDCDAMGIVCPKREKTSEAPPLDTGVKHTQTRASGVHAGTANAAAPSPGGDPKSPGAIPLASEPCAHRWTKDTFGLELCLGCNVRVHRCHVRGRQPVLRPSEAKPREWSSLDDNADPQPWIACKSCETSPAATWCRVCIEEEYEAVNGITTDVLEYADRRLCGGACSNEPLKGWCPNPDCDLVMGHNRECSLRTNVPRTDKPLPTDLRACLDVLVKGGTMVSSNECSAIEIAAARACNRFYVDANSLGYVARPKAPPRSETPRVGHGRNGPRLLADRLVGVLDEFVPPGVSSDVWTRISELLDGIRELEKHRSETSERIWSWETAESTWIAIARNVPANRKKTTACAIVDLFVGSGASKEEMRHAKTLAFDSGIPWMKAPPTGSEE